MGRGMSKVTFPSGASVEFVANGDGNYSTTEIRMDPYQKDRDALDAKINLWRERCNGGVMREMLDLIDSLMIDKEPSVLCMELYARARRIKELQATADSIEGLRQEITMLRQEMAAQFSITRQQREERRGRTVVLQAETISAYERTLKEDSHIFQQAAEKTGDIFLLLRPDMHLVSDEQLDHMGLIRKETLLATSWPQAVACHSRGQIQGFMT